MIEACTVSPAFDLLAPVGGREAGGDEVALHVHVDDEVPLLLGHRHEHAVAQDPGVVDQDVEATEGAHRGLDQGAATLPVGDVVVGRDGLAPAGADLRGRLLGHLPEVVDDDLGALVGEEERMLPPQPATCTGDDRDPTLE